MSDATHTIAVVGGGLAAHIAARRLHSRGHRVVLMRRTARGTTALWGGLGFAFGPFAAALPDSAGAVEARPVGDRSFTADRHRRWERLERRRGTSHPYRRLELDLDGVADHLSEALESLDELPLAGCADGRVVPGPHGQPAAPDVVASSVASLDLSGIERLGLVECPGLSGWRAHQLSYQFDRIDGLQCVLVSAAPFQELAGGHPVRLAHQLEEHLDEAADPTDALSRAIEASEAQFVILPPCLGGTVAAHRNLIARLRADLPVPFAEMPAAEDAIFGWRNAQALRQAEQRFDRIVETEVVDLRGGSPGRIDAVIGADGTEVEVDAAVIATGRWIDGGLPGSAPFTEPVSGAPLWLDDAPLPGHREAFPGNFLGERPWDDHRLLRTGVAVDNRGRPMGADGSAKWENVFAAGRMLGGFNPAHDGCAMGVELVSARVVADRAAALLSSKAPPNR